MQGKNYKPTPKNKQPRGVRLKTGNVSKLRNAKSELGFQICHWLPLSAFEYLSRFGMQRHKTSRLPHN